MITNQQKFARIAHQQAEAIAQTHAYGSAYRQKYGSMAHKLPILIRKAGLAQAFAFLQAKQEDAYTDLLNHLAEAVSWPGAGTGAALAEKSRSEPVDTYILLTRRITAALVWYKRFAESVLGVKPTDDAPEGGTP